MECISGQHKHDTMTHATSSNQRIVSCDQHYNRVGSSGLSGSTGSHFSGSTGSDPLYKISRSDPDLVMIMMSRGDDVLDDVSISYQYISKRVIVDGMETPRKVTRYIALWFKVACTAMALAIYIPRSYDAPGAYQCYVVAVLMCL